MGLHRGVNNGIVHGGNRGMAHIFIKMCAMAVLQMDGRPVAHFDHISCWATKKVITVDQLFYQIIPYLLDHQQGNFLVILILRLGHVI